MKQISEQTVEPTEQTKPKHQMVLYDLCSRDFEVENLYAIGGIRPNARHIAHQYGCKLEFRLSRYRQVGNEMFSTSYLARRGIAEDGSCLSAILVGDDREKLLKARTDIHGSCGAAPFDAGAIDISDEKTIFS